MATGAGEQYWESQALPSVLKHDLLERYLPRFAGKTGSVARGVVYLDGYAGRGRYENGTPASAERILKIAEEQGVKGINYQLFFHEKDRKSYSVLESVVAEYVGRGVKAQAARGEVIGGLDAVIKAADGLPLFLFLDPCGLGVPFSELAGILSGPRSAVWPPTEILLNFSLEAVRRIAGHVSSSTPDPKSMSRLDDALGGNWWRSLVANGVTDHAVSSVVKGFMQRLADAAKMEIYTVDVRRAPGHKPVYSLVFGTRKKLGLWHFADDTARATETWWSTLDADEAARRQAEEEELEAVGLVPLFDMQLPASHPDIAEVEEEARPQIAENIARIAAEYGTFKVGDYPDEVFGDYLGRVRETVVRKAIKDLYANGRTASNGKGTRIPDLLVSPPQP
jgi:three-Cys-motif partner protein